ncbi:hypothetical protein DPMN_189899 [Dreissena polymorpha]|uniref:Uncharacterized protein n=3 Tax=Dreissena polymorpha TaxID=45954 RepID=A0A9D4DWB0_DREPO|nr:hypothetical protein DPMN_189899 [Dreissena polymorpha]
MEIAGRLPALLQVKSESHETKLLEDSLTASVEDCRLVPYVPCYTIPSESELYNIENGRVPVNPKLSPISNDSSHFATLTEDNCLLIWDVDMGELETTVILMEAEHPSLNVMVKPPNQDVIIVGTTHQSKGNPIFIVNINTGEIEHKLQAAKMGELCCCKQLTVKQETMICSRKRFAVNEERSVCAGKCCEISQTEYKTARI